MKKKGHGFWAWYRDLHWGWKALALILIVLSVIFIVCFVFVIVYAIVGALVYVLGGGWLSNVGKSGN
jgi:hypothetical protein